MPWSQLHWCAFRNDVQGIRKLTEGGGCFTSRMDPNIPDQAGATPLHIACQHGQCHAVRALLDAGAEAHNKTELPREGSGMLDGGETPLLWVVKLRYTPDDLRTVRNPEAELHNGHVEAARLLIDVGKADVNAQTHVTEVTALHEAARYGWRQLMTLLLLKGASCTIKAKDGATPKDYARGDLRRMLELHEAEQAAYRQGSDERERGVTSRSVSPQTPPVPARNTLGA